MPDAICTYRPGTVIGLGAMEVSIAFDYAALLAKNVVWRRTGGAQ